MKGFMYWFVIIDVFSRSIIDDELSSTLEKGFVLDCPKRAITKANPEIINAVLPFPKIRTDLP